MPEAGDWNLIIEKVTTSNLAQAASDFAQAFGLDTQLTQAMLKTSPIMFVTGLTKSEVKALTPKLTDLSKSGFEFRVTQRVAKIPKVNWLKRPNFTAADSGANGIAFDWQNQAFVCPGCGETFVFARAGKLPLAEAPAAPAPAAAAAGGTSKSGTGQTVAATKTSTGKMPPTRVEKVELKLDGDDQPKTETRKTFPPAPAPIKVKKEEPKPVESLELKEPDETASEVEEFSLDLEEKPGDAPEPLPSLDESGPGAEPLEIDLSSEAETAPPPPEPAPNVAKKSTGKQTAVAKAEPKKEEALSEALEEGLEEAKKEKSEVVPEGDVYNVFVPEVKDAAKREEVVKLITEIRGCSADEARKLTRRLMIPVAKNVGKEEAEEILTKFRKLKITGRMTKVSRGDGE